MKQGSRPGRHRGEQAISNDTDHEPEDDLIQEHLGQAEQDDGAQRLESHRCTHRR